MNPLERVYFYSYGEEIYPSIIITADKIDDNLYIVTFDQTCVFDKYMDITSKYKILSKTHEHIKKGTDDMPFYKTIITMKIETHNNPPPEDLFKYLNKDIKKQKLYLYYYLDYYHLVDTFDTLEDLMLNLKQICDDNHEEYPDIAPSYEEYVSNNFDNYNNNTRDHSFYMPTKEEIKKLKNEEYIGIISSNVDYYCLSTTQLK
jgi:hypothetical protein